jgi:hypothetical protein
VKTRQQNPSLTYSLQLSPVRQLEVFLTSAHPHHLKHSRVGYHQLPQRSSTHSIPHSPDGSVAAAIPPSTLQAADVQSSWYLEPYQRVPGQVDSFLEHIRGGVLQAAADPRALLLFSGGETRASAGPISEAASYWMVAQGQQWFGACIDMVS